MADIKFSAQERGLITNKLCEYLREQFELDIGQFDAEFLLDFITREFGAVYYNAGLRDAQAQLSLRVDDVIEAIGDLEQATGIDR